MATKTPRTKTTKKDRLVRLLSAKAGADAASLSARLGWQAHTTRAAITGLRKAGYEIAAEKTGPGKATRYRIVGQPETGEADRLPAPAAAATSTKTQAEAADAG